jgi:acetylornithine deacetylase/succinyl-diaminopimelate desuccinylase-like protein
VQRPFGFEIEVLRRWPGYMLAEDEPITRAAGAAVSAAGLPIVCEADLAANDSSWLVGAGIPTVLLGPGEPAQSHATRESLRIDDLAKACSVYSELILSTTQRE